MPPKTQSLPGRRAAPSRAQRTLDRIDRLARLVRAPRHQGALVPAQWEALSYLARANCHSRTPGAVAHYLGATKGTVSQTLMALERRGLVVKAVSPADARSVRIELTEAGREALLEAPLEPLARALQSLPGARRGDVDQALDTLLMALLAAAGGKTFGICKSCRYFQAAAGGSAGPHRCGLLVVPLSDADSELICAEQQPA